MMKLTSLVIAGLFTILLQAETQKPTTLKGVLLEQLQTTHNKEDWFVPVNIALKGLTPEQARWSPGKGTHSAGQLANHLLFWNTQALARFKGEKPAKFSGNNDETFNQFDSKNWAETLQRLDAILDAWEKEVASADDAKVSKEASLIAHVGAHNAYHTGQIITLRKLQGSWDAKNGVK